MLTRAKDILKAARLAGVIPARARGYNVVPGIGPYAGAWAIIRKARPVAIVYLLGGYGLHKRRSIHAVRARGTVERFFYVDGRGQCWATFDVIRRF